VKITACARPESNFGDSYLRLFNESNFQVCENDDDLNNECGDFLPAIKYYRGEAGCEDFILREGCVDNTECGGAFDYEITPECTETGYSDCNFLEDNGEEVELPDRTYLWIVLACVAVCVIIPFIYWAQQPLRAIFLYEKPPLPPVKQRKTRAIKNANANEADFDNISLAEGVDNGSLGSGGSLVSMPIGTKTEASGDGYNQLQLTDF